MPARSELAAEKFSYRRGLHDLGSGAYAWLQPDGGWGWSNAGLVVDSGESLLVDTLFDLPLTREMLAAMGDAEPAARRIGTLVNTHANGDHCFGNQLVAGARIIASAVAAEEMAQAPPARLEQVLEAGRGASSETAAFLRHCFGAFDWRDITLTLPTATFCGRLALAVGGKRVELVEVGPAHTGGDLLVHLPDQRLIYTGDILFVDGTPVMWAGPVQNWIDACDRILELDVDTVVPGHGPITDRRGPQAVKSYLEYVRDQARLRYDAGLDAFAAAQDIALADFSAWGDAERIVVNVHTLYREFSGTDERPDVAKLFGQMALLARR